ncbi:MAG TPA: hypothetical protein VGP82_21805 [Ktedonobacterales bacterium]|nr:hypothetical protein [Ktedonobacterales bacterium]
MRRCDFPGYGGENLPAISWDEFLKTLNGRNLVVVFQEHQKAGNQSNFCRFDNPTREDA